jgi:hypothetical protein
MLRHTHGMLLHNLCNVVCASVFHIPLHIHYKGLHIFYEDPKRLNCFEVRPIVSCKQLPTFWKGISRNQLQVSSIEDAITVDNIIRFMDAFVGCNDREKLGFSFKDLWCERLPLSVSGRAVYSIIASAYYPTYLFKTFLSEYTSFHISIL